VNDRNASGGLDSSVEFKNRKYDMFRPGSEAFKSLKSRARRNSNHSRDFKARMKEHGSLSQSSKRRRSPRPSSARKTKASANGTRAVFSTTRLSS